MGDGQPTADPLRSARRRYFRLFARRWRQSPRNGNIHL